ncbi:MAG: twin-arginine translocase TatA/TatE family subunit [Spirochaetes bacterium]|nr:twin-arginine translocase TatA/TatE family subunit [Spirochaetota bacterium]
MFGRIGPTELILILVIALVIFGPKKLPEIGKALGEALRQFRKQAERVTDDADERPDASAHPPAGGSHEGRDRNDADGGAS